MVIDAEHLALGGVGLAALLVVLAATLDALVVEPLLRLRVTEYRVDSPGWPADLPLTMVVLADIHAVEPWMRPGRIRTIVAAANALRPDLVLLAGDYEAGLPLVAPGRVGSLRGFLSRLARPVPMEEVAAALAGLRASLGTYAVLGNHDVAVRGGQGVRQAFAAHGLPVLENRAVRLGAGEGAFWLLGLADQWRLGARRSASPLADLPGTLAQVTDDRPALLLAHEPDIFPTVPERVALTLSGHTHGGQVRLPGIGAVVVPSRHGARYALGHIVEGGRHLIVSGGLGVSGLPVRFLMPPEIVLVRLGGAARQQV